MWLPKMLGTGSTTLHPSLLPVLLPRTPIGSIWKTRRVKSAMKEEAEEEAEKENIEVDIGAPQEKQ